MKTIKNILNINERESYSEEFSRRLNSVEDQTERVYMENRMNREID